MKKKLIIFGIVVMIVLLSSRVYYERNLYKEFSIDWSQDYSQEPKAYENLNPSQSLTAAEMREVLISIGIDAEIVAQMGEQELVKYTSAERIEVTVSWWQVSRSGKTTWIEASDISDTDKCLYVKKTEFLICLYEDNYWMAVQAELVNSPYMNIKFELAAMAYMASTDDDPMRGIYVYGDSDGGECQWYDLTESVRFSGDGWHYGCRLIDSIRCGSKEKNALWIQYEFSPIGTDSPLDTISTFKCQPTFLQ